VGLVVLLPAEVDRRARALNRRLADRTLRLGPRALPHLTLAMACVDRDAVPEIAAALDALATGQPPFAVRLARTVTVTGAHDTAWYEASPGRTLGLWHRRCVALLEAHRRPGPAARDFAGPRGRAIAPSARRWVRRFARDAAFTRYRPHVTLGYGAAPADPRLPATFHARRLALVHLGDHCTCARVLAERRLVARRAPRPGQLA
jgi:2'-5' RNA ligase